MPSRILLVDDDIAEIAAVKRVLQRAGHRAVLATNASAALAAAAAGRPDLALVAGDCEGGEGAEVARLLAGEAVPRPVPVVLLGDPVPGVVGRVLARPVDAASLEEELRRALEATPPPPASAPAPAPPPAAAQAGPSLLDLTGPSPAAEAAALREAEAALRARGAERDAQREGETETSTSSTAPASPSQSRDPAPGRDRGQGSTPTSTPGSRAAHRPAPDQHLPPALLAGDGSALTAPRLLALVASSRATGRLDVLLDPPRALWFEDGQVVGAASDAPGERPLDVAGKLGLVTPAQHAVLAPTAAGLGSRRVGVLLLEEGLLEARELSVLARARAQEIAAAILEGRAGHRFAPGAIVPTSERVVIGGGTLPLCVEGIRRRWGAPRIEARLGGGDTLLAPGDDAGLLAAMSLEPDEVQLARGADGTRTLDELLEATRLAPGEGRALLAALVELGVLAVAQRAEPGASRSRAAAADLARVEEKLALVRNADYFEILGVGRDSTGHEIGVAADRLLAGLAPERFPGALPALAAKLDEIRAVAAEAREVLCDDRLRSDYARATDQETQPCARSGVAEESPR